MILDYQIYNFLLDEIPIPDMSILDTIGFFGPLIVFIISFIKLWKQTNYLIGYIIFHFINKYINNILKVSIRQNRPIGGRSIINETYTGINKYGMPSSHTQAVAYSIAFLYLTKGSIPFLILEIFILALTFYQRWKYRRHTIEQLTIGIIVGSLIGVIGHYITKYIIHKI